MSEFSTSPTNAKAGKLFHKLKWIARNVTAHIDRSKVSLAMALNQQDYDLIRIIRYRGKYPFENLNNFEILYLIEEVLAKDDQLKV